MGIGLSILLIAIGAVLRFALETSVEGINLGATGVILMLVGGLGLILSLLFWSSFSPSRRRAEVEGSTVVQETTTRERDVA